MRTTTLCMATLICLFGCDDGGGAGDPGAAGASDATTTGPSSDSTLASAADGLRAAHAVPEAVRTEATTSANVLVNALFAATEQAGSTVLVSHGTLQPMGDTWVWSAEPGDALIVEAPDARWVFNVEEAIASDPSSPDAALAGDHRLRFRVRIDDRADLRISSVRSGTGREATVDGTLTVGGVAWNVEGLRLVGDDRFENDASGSAYESAEVLTGRGRSSGARFDLDERWHFELVTSTRPRGSAQTAQRVVNSDVTIAGSRYTWVDGTTRKAFRDGKPSDEDFWTASGEVRRDGAPYGRYRMDIQSFGADGAGFVLFFIDTPDGTIELERVQAW